MTVGRNCADDRDLVILCRMEVDAVEIVPGLLGRDCESCTVDQRPELARGQREIVRQLAAGHYRVVLWRQTLQGESRAARAQHHRVALAAGLDLDLRALAQLPDDVVEGVRRRGRSAFSINLDGNALDDLEIHIGGAQRQPSRFGAQQHIRQYRNCRAPFDHALHVGQRFKESRPFDDEFHGCCIEVKL